MALEEDKAAVARRFAGEDVGLRHCRAATGRDSPWRPDRFRRCRCGANAAPAPDGRRLKNSGSSSTRAVSDRRPTVSAASGRRRDAVQMQHRGMGGQAGEQGRDGADLGPVDQMRQLRPIRFVAQIVGGGLGAGDDQGVDIGGLQEAGIVIKAVHARRGVSRCAAMRAQGKQAQPHIQRPAASFSRRANCSSVARIAASGMLLTSPTCMAARLWPPPSRNCSTRLIPRPALCGARSGGQRLVQVGDDVVAMLDADRQADGFGRHARLDAVRPPASGDGWWRRDDRPATWRRRY